MILPLYARSWEGFGKEPVIGGFCTYKFHVWIAVAANIPVNVVAASIGGKPTVESGELFGRGPSIVSFFYGGDQFMSMVFIALYALTLYKLAGGLIYAI